MHMENVRSEIIPFLLSGCSLYSSDQREARLKKEEVCINAEFKKIVSILTKYKTPVSFTLKWFSKTEINHIKLESHVKS